MKKETFQDKLIKRFYGIAGPLDEFRQKEASRLGNTCFILLFWGTMALTLLASSFHVKSLLFGGMMGLFASLALSALAYLQKLEADTAKKK
ncbi:membrane protein [Streptococcus suis]|nr:DUF3278 domain-containing protein [Streptococcus suis]CYY60393.1 membrane protein [Streptococcus suis]CZA03335.1 membrane protein [Streptococcus suis]CZA10131.1 membrane protein [Streptococcus suis]CZA11108.1 membrane protein [Streptococcus suis]CZA15412.1 membrane protein [Streptococcus suis]